MKCMTVFKNLAQSEEMCAKLDKSKLVEKLCAFNQTYKTQRSWGTPQSLEIIVNLCKHSYDAFSDADIDRLITTASDLALLPGQAQVYARRLISIIVHHSPAKLKCKVQ